MISARLNRAHPTKIRELDFKHNIIKNINIMKLRNLFYLLLALPLAFAACEEEPTPAPEQDPVLTLTSAEEAHFFAEGGPGVISYTLENAKEGVKLQATTTSEWITNLTVSDTIVYTVEANDSEEAREGVIVVSYDAASFNVTVKQDGKKVTAAPVFELTTEDTMIFGWEFVPNAEIGFKLENPIEGMSVTANSAASWLSNFKVEQNKVVFRVSENTGDAREAEVVIAYGPLTLTVKVKQTAYEAPAPVLTVAENEVTIAAEGGAGEIAYTVENAIEGITVAASTEADWISNFVVSDDKVTFEAAANELSVPREAKIVLAYGDITAEVTVKQPFANQNPDLNYKVYTIEMFRAQAQSANSWDIIMSEIHPTMGEMFTRISIQLPENNAMYITDGTYSVADGSVLLNTIYDNSYSTYRYNSSGDDIIDANVTVTNDLEAQTTVVIGSFQVGSDVFTFEYRGYVEGFMYEELSDEGITEWDKFFIYSQWDDTKYIVAKASGVTIDLYLKKLGGKKSDPLAAGTYPVGDWEYTTTRDYCDNSSTKINGTLLVSGEWVVEEDPAGYKVTFDVIDANGTNWKGTYVGPIQ